MKTKFAVLTMCIGLLVLLFAGKTPAIESAPYEVRGSYLHTQKHGNILINADSPYGCDTYNSYNPYDPYCVPNPYDPYNSGVLYDPDSEPYGEPYSGSN